MKPLYFVNVGILTFATTAFLGEARLFSPYPKVFYAFLALLLIVLVVGILPYRVRSINPALPEFLLIFFSLILGAISWF